MFSTEGQTIKSVNQLAYQPCWKSN